MIEIAKFKFHWKFYSCRVRPVCLSICQVDNRCGFRHLTLIHRLGRAVFGRLIPIFALSALRGCAVDGLIIGTSFWPSVTNLICLPFSLTMNVIMIILQPRGGIGSRSFFFSCMLNVYNFSETVSPLPLHVRDRFPSGDMNTFLKFKYSIMA